ncbi:hypothetical protein PVAND_007587 [Polypedilum vanderplanki]|uniref:C2H2-type domain-containing protein n=1 Tax=Polypedilum vanderplanki TaxID=319348 RepID=A0A9J6C8A1_POLVA|nr:hypothetical protein PVAND_007587 [Polypedilum vanderplanki]
MAQRLIKSVNIEPSDVLNDSESEYFSIRLVLNKYNFGSAGTSFEFSSDDSKIKFQINVNREATKEVQKIENQEQFSIVNNDIVEESSFQDKPVNNKKRKRSTAFSNINENEGNSVEEEQPISLRKRQRWCRNVSKVQNSLKALNSEIENSNDDKNEVFEKPISIKKSLRPKQIKKTVTFDINKEILNKKKKMIKKVNDKKNLAKSAKSVKVPIKSDKISKKAKETSVKHEESDEILRCEIDGKIFEKKSLLTKHMKCHELRKCLICNKMIKLTSFSSHTRLTHSTSKKLKCKICDKKIKSARSMVHHMLTHDKDRNRRAKWKKRKKTTNVFRTPGSLLPSHGLPPFGANITNIAMSESLCGTSMFGSDRWSVGVNPMTAGDSMMYHNTTGTNGNCSGPGGGGGGNSPNSTPPNINACSSTTPPLSSGQTSQSDGNGNELNTNQQQQLVSCQNIATANEGEDDVWRGHSIAALRRRASELNATTSIPLYAHNYEHHVY